MGSLISKQLDKSFDKQMTFQREAQEMQTMRQLAMQNLLRERAMAMQIAGARDTFMWLLSFTTFVAVGTTIGHLRTKDPRLAIPLVPLIFATGYFYDLAHGDKIERMRRDAENILLEDIGLVAMPCGVPTFFDIERRRESNRKEEDLVPNQLFL